MARSEQYTTPGRKTTSGGFGCHLLERGKLDAIQTHLSLKFLIVTTEEGDIHVHVLIHLPFLLPGNHIDYTEI